MREWWIPTVCIWLTQVKHDLYADKPWAFSPLLSTVYRAQANRAEASFEAKAAKELFTSDEWPAFPTPDNDSKQKFVKEDIAPLFYQNEKGERTLDSSTGVDEKTVEHLGAEDASLASRTRASWLGNKNHRENLTITPSDVLTVDFCNGFIDFNSLQLVLPYAGLRFDLQRYWDGQPVRYVCKNLASGRIYFVVQYVGV